MDPFQVCERKILKFSIVKAMQHRVNTLVRTIWPTLHKESRPRFNSNQVFLLEQELKSAPKGFTLGVKAEIEKIFSICPKLLINAKLYGLVLAPRLKRRIPTNLGSQFATLGANVPAIFNILMSMF
jgi:hypothetical protein